MSFHAIGKNTKLGKGALFLDFFDANGAATGLQFLGNCPAISVSADVQKAELFSGTEQSSPLVDSAVTRVSYTVQATLNEFTVRNLQTFLLAEAGSRNQTLGNAGNVAISNIVVGRYYDVGFRSLTAVVVMRGSDVLTLDSDYTLDATHGIIGTRKGGAHTLVDGDDLIVTQSHPALTLDQLRVAKIASPTARLLYLADDANASGSAAKDRLELWRVNLAPEGELNLVSDDYGSFQITAAVTDDSTNHPSAPFGILERVQPA